MNFEWDDGKNTANLTKHNVSFFEAQLAFADPIRIIAQDLSHSKTEERFYCFGKVQGGRAHGAVYLSGPRHSNHRRRVLAQGKGSI